VHTQDVAHAARLVALEAVCLSLLRSTDHDDAPVTGLSIQATNYGGQVHIDLQYLQGAVVVSGEAV
jgi:hypothetical protein